VRWSAAGCAALLLAGLAGCGGSAVPPGAAGTGSGPGSGTASGPGSSGAPATSGVAVRSPGVLTAPTLSSDVLVYSTRSLPDSAVRRIKAVRGVVATERFALAQFYYQENQVRYAAANPATFRRWTQNGVANATDVWKRVAGGEIAVRPDLAKRIEDRNGYVHLGDTERAPTVHVGAYAQLFDARFNDLSVDAVLNQKWVSRLGMVPDNALLVSTGRHAPAPVATQLRKLLGKGAGVQLLGPSFDPDTVRTAVVTGDSATAVGRFTYTANRNGSVNIQGSWVADNIRTEQVPILGAITCNKVMFPQLVAALREIEQRGLAKDIHPGQYGGCFVPRFIAGTHTLSYHAFGLAVDLNVPENQRGTRGRMNRQIVEIFERWGFGWGGHWRWTDPMHFELHRVVHPS
jgi:hypothetical protein